jgi:hypothetical protein
MYRRALSFLKNLPWITVRAVGDRALERKISRGVACWGGRRAAVKVALLCIGSSGIGVVLCPAGFAVAWANSRCLLRRCGPRRFVARCRFFFFFFGVVVVVALGVALAVLAAFKNALGGGPGGGAGLRVAFAVVFAFKMALVGG